MKRWTTSLLCGATAAAAAAFPSTGAAAQATAPVMASGALTDWYDQVVADTGEHVRDAVRVFLVPGMTHCGGSQATDQFDMLDAIMAWVEDGRAPDRIVATGDAFPGVSRPLCPYPLVARYEGGNPDDAGSFACRE